MLDLIFSLKISIVQWYWLNLKFVSLLGNLSPLVMHWSKVISKIRVKSKLVHPSEILLDCKGMIVNQNHNVRMSLWH